MTQLSDEILIAYMDGELGAAQVGVIDKVLAADGVTQKQLQRMQSTSTRLSQAFSSMLQAEAKQIAIDRASNAPVQQIQPIEHAPSNPLQNIMVPAMAAGVLLVSVGAIGGYLAGNTPGGGPASDPFDSGFWNKERLTSEQVRSKSMFAELNAQKTTKTSKAAISKAAVVPETTASTSRPKAGSFEKWYDSVALHHKTDAAQLLDQYNGKSRNYELALFQFSNSDVAPTMIPILRDEQLTFAGASPVQIKGQKYARLTYRDVSNGALPVGLYVGNQKGGSLTLERGYRGDENYVRWRQGERSYMLIGAVPHWRLIVLCVAVQRQLVQ